MQTNVTKQIAAISKMKKEKKTLRLAKLHEGTILELRKAKSNKNLT